MLLMTLDVIYLFRNMGQGILMIISSIQVNMQDFFEYLTNVYFDMIRP